MKQETSAALVVVLLSVPLAAMAQSSVTLGGRIKEGVDHVTYSGGSTAKGPSPDLSATRVTDNSSYWFVKGEEDLGGRTRAFFHLEYGLSSHTGDLGAGRFSAVGLSNPNWGRILLGRWSTYFASDSVLSPGGINDAGPYASGTLNVLGPIGKRGQYFSGGFLSNTVRYDSPRWKNAGFAASYSFDTETPNQASNRTLNFNPTYDDGALFLYANVLRRNHQPNAAGTFVTDYGQTSWRLGAGYQFDSGFRAAVLWDRNKVDGTAVAGGRLSRDAWAIPISYRTGLHLFSITYGKAKAYQTAGVTTPDTGATMLSLGYEYALSKRTFLSANFSTVRNQPGAAYDFWQSSNTLAMPAGLVGFRSRYVYAGVKHVF